MYIEIGERTAEGFAIGVEQGTAKFVNPAMDQMLMAGKGARRVLSLPDRAEANLNALIEKEPAFIPKLKEIAEKLQTKPEWLLQLMALETAGTFSPSITNKQGYTGLIQFGAGARKDLGITQQQLQGMTATRQLDEVLKYFTSNKGKAALDSLMQLYSIVALPAIKNLSESAVVASTKYKPTRFKNNPAWNVVKDDVIYKSELGLAAGSALRPEAALRALGANPSSAPALPRAVREDVVVLPKAQLPRLFTAFPTPSLASASPLPVTIANADVPLGVEAKQLAAPLEALTFATSALSKMMQANAAERTTALKASFSSTFGTAAMSGEKIMGENDVVSGGGAKTLFGGAPLSVTDASGNEIANPSKLQAAMAGVRAATTEMKEMGKEAFGSFAQGLGGIIEQFVLTGEAGPQAMRKLTAGVLASLAAQAAVKAIFYTAEGIAAATNPLTAWMAPGYFASAAMMAGIAGGAAVAGRVVASGIRKEGQQQGAGGNGENRDVTSESYAGNQFERRVKESFKIGHTNYQNDQQAIQTNQLLGVIINKLNPVNGQQMVLATLANNPRAVAQANVAGVNGDFATGNRLGQRIVG